MRAAVKFVMCWLNKFRFLQCIFFRWGEYVEVVLEWLRSLTFKWWKYTGLTAPAIYHCRAVAVWKWNNHDWFRRGLESRLNSESVRSGTGGALSQNKTHFHHCTGENNGPFCLKWHWLEHPLMLFSSLKCRILYKPRVLLYRVETRCLVLKNKILEYSAKKKTTSSVYYKIKIAVTFYFFHSLCVDSTSHYVTT